MWDEDVSGHGGAVDLVVQVPAHQTQGQQLLALPPAVPAAPVEEHPVGLSGAELELDHVPGEEEEEEEEVELPVVNAQSTGSSKLVVSV